MPALSQDTRLVMTILFVGVMSGTNVFVYAQFGTSFPYGSLAHSILFGLGTIGSIMVMKALFAIDEQQRQKMRESAKQYNTSFNNYQPVQTEEENTIGNEFLAALQ